MKDVGLAESRDQLLTQKHLIGKGTGHDKLKVVNSRGGRLAVANVAYKVMMMLGGLDAYAAALGALYAQVDHDLALERDEINELALRPRVVLGDADEAMAMVEAHHKSSSQQRRVASHAHAIFREHATRETINVRGVRVLRDDFLKGLEGMEDWPLEGGAKHTPTCAENSRLAWVAAIAARRA